jgi:two-component system chemotaxis family response regulator WspR
VTEEQTVDKPWPRILLVEDNTDDAERIADALHDHFRAVHIMVAATGQQACQPDLTQFDVVLLNIDLPDCTGLDVLRHIFAHHDLPVLMVTRHCDGDSVATAVRSGACDYIVKQGGYPAVLPVLVEKALVMAELKDQNRRLQQALRRRNEQLQQVNGQLESSNRLLRQMAERDPLTGLSNRRHFNELLDRRRAEAQRYRYDLACMMIDVDNFKQINDRLGHKAGDRILVLVAGILRAQLRAADLPARYGGDEFVVLLPHSTAMDACTLARRIADQFRHDVAQIVPDSLDCSLSIGIHAVHADRPATASEWVEKADHALLEAKQSGKGCVVLSAEPGSRSAGLPSRSAS